MFRVGQEEIDAVARVINSKQLFRINNEGKEAENFEKELAEKSARLKELNILLNMDQKGRSVLDDSPDPVSEDKEKTKEQER